jgi:hypothetical protein
MVAGSNPVGGTMKFHKSDKYYGWWFESKHLKIWDDGFTLFGFHLGWMHPWAHDSKAYGHPHRLYITIPKVGHWMIGLPSRRGTIWPDDERKYAELNARVPWHIAGTVKWSDEKQDYVSDRVVYTPYKKG